MNNREEGENGSSKNVRSSRALRKRRLKIDERRLDQFAMAGLTTEELAATLNVSAEQLERDYGEAIQQAAARGVGLLKRKGFELAVVNGSEKMLSLLMLNRGGLDKQAQEMRALEVRERRLRVEQMENEERERARLARELQRIQIARGQLALRGQQQLALGARRQEGYANLDNMTEQEIATALNNIQLQLKFLNMAPEQRQELVTALPEVGGKPLVLSDNGDPDSQDVLLWLSALDAEERAKILLLVGIDLNKKWQP